MESLKSVTGRGEVGKSKESEFNSTIVGQRSQLLSDGCNQRASNVVCIPPRANVCVSVCMYVCMCVCV